MILKGGRLLSQMPISHLAGDSECPVGSCRKAADQDCNHAGTSCFQLSSAISWKGFGHCWRVEVKEYMRKVLPTQPDTGGGAHDGGKYDD